MRAQLIEVARRADEVVRVGERIRVARAALQGVCETAVSAKLSQVFAAPALIEKRGVVRIGEVVVRARREVVGAQRRRRLLNVGREFGGLVGRAGRGFDAQTCERGRRGQRETRIGAYGDQRV